MVYFAGGGVSVNEQTARNDTYNTKLVTPDFVADATMNMGWTCLVAEGNPFKDLCFLMLQEISIAEQEN